MNEQASVHNRTGSEWDNKPTQNDKFVPLDGEKWHPFKERVSVLNSIGTKMNDCLESCLQMKEGKKIIIFSLSSSRIFWCFYTYIQ